MNENNFLIDKITNRIEEVASGKTFDTDVIIVGPEINKIFKKDGWQFNWRMESKIPNRRIYKLVIKGGSQIQGLISIEEMNGFIEMHLIEAAPHNFGNIKTFYGVAANLVAFACRLSFDLSFEGYVSFTSKTALVEHYERTLGATLVFNNKMRIASEAAKKLVNSYYKGYINERQKEVLRTGRYRFYRHAGKNFRCPEKEKYRRDDRFH